MHTTDYIGISFVLCITHIYIYIYMYMCISLYIDIHILLIIFRITYYTNIVLYNIIYIYI